MHVCEEAAIGQSTSVVRILSPAVGSCSSCLELVDTLYDVSYGQEYRQHDSSLVYRLLVKGTVCVALRTTVASEGEPVGTRLMSAGGELDPVSPAYSTRRPAMAPVLFCADVHVRT